MEDYFSSGRALTWRQAAVLIPVFALITSTAAAHVYWLEGKVIGITDGDTLTLLTDGRQQVRVRLVGIDAPESGQPYSAKSKRALSDLAFGKQVSVRTAGSDRYGRVLGVVFADETDVNRELLRVGAAWVYRQYEDSESLLALEEIARRSRRGLWDLPEYDQVPPWEWRSGNRPPSTSVKQADFTCGSKSYCRDMKSCEEARFYLTECGLTRLDGDSDGVPCESICR